MPARESQRCQGFRSICPCTLLEEKGDCSRFWGKVAGLGEEKELLRKASAEQVIRGNAPHCAQPGLAVRAPGWLGADEAAHKLFARDGLVAERKTVFDAFDGFGELSVGIVKDGYQGFAGGATVADAFVKFKTHAGIDSVFLFFAATAEHGQGDAELHAIGGRQVAIRAGLYFLAMASLRQAGVVVDDPGVTALQPDTCTEFFERFTGSNQVCGEHPAFVDGFGSLTEEKHPGGKFNAEFAQVCSSAAPQDFNRFDDF